MSLSTDLKSMDINTAAWITKMAIMQYFLGQEALAVALGKKEDFLIDLHDYLPVDKVMDYRYNDYVSNTIPFRGLVCQVMDNLGFRDFDQRDAILHKLTGVSHSQWLESERQHRISQGDWWLK